MTETRKSATRKPPRSSSARQGAGKKVPCSVPSQPKTSKRSAHDYSIHRDNAAKRMRQIAQSGCEIGKVPVPADTPRRELALRSLRVFCETYFSKRFFLAWSEDHLVELERIQKGAVEGELFALAAPRGFGKTSLCEVAALWAALRGLHKYFAFIAATKNKAIQILDSIKVELASNELLAADFPEVCYPIQSLEHIMQRSRGQLCAGEPTAMSWSASKLVLPTIGPKQSPWLPGGSPASGAIFHVAGITSGEILGLKHTIRVADGKTAVVRPSFIIVDDPQTPESAHSPSQNERRLAILAGPILGLAGPGRKLAGFALVTVIEPGDMADQLLDRKKHPTWQGERFKMVYGLPTNEKLWNDYSLIRSESFANGLGLAPATAFYVEHREEMDAGCRPSWPARFDPDEASAVQHAMELKLRDEAVFFSEYQNEPIISADEIRVAPPDEIAGKVSGFARGLAPSWAHTITAMIDCHDKLHYYAVVAWGDDFTGQVIDYGTWPDQHAHYFTLRACRRTLAMSARGAGREGAILAGMTALSEHLLGRAWNRDDGTTLPIRLCLVDAGYVRDIVFEFCRTSKYTASLMPSRGHYIGAGRKPLAEYNRSKGDRLGPHWYQPLPARGERIRHVLVDINYWKSFVHYRLGVARGDAGALCLFGSDPVVHKLIADHLTAEFPIQTEGPYGAVDEWRQKPDHPDNHWLDCLVGCAAAASISGVGTPGLASAQAPRGRKRYTQADLALKEWRGR